MHKSHLRACACSTWSTVGVVDREVNNNSKKNPPYLWWSWPVSSIWSQVKPIFLPHLTAWSYLWFAQMPTSWDLAIFVPTVTTDNYFTPCTHVRKVLMIITQARCSRVRRLHHLLLVCLMLESNCCQAGSSVDCHLRHRYSTMTKPACTKHSTRGGHHYIHCTDARDWDQNLIHPNYRPWTLDRILIRSLTAWSNWMLAWLLHCCTEVWPRLFSIIDTYAACDHGGWTCRRA